MPLRGFVTKAAVNKISVTRQIRTFMKSVHRSYWLYISFQVLWFVTILICHGNKISSCYDYSWGDIKLSELAQIIMYPGFRKMAMKYAGFGFKEMIRSFIVPLQVMQLQRYIPELTEADVMQGPSGVRAQAMEVDGNTYIYIFVSFFPFIYLSIFPTTRKISFIDSSPSRLL